jgi:putative transposase
MKRRYRKGTGTSKRGGKPGKIARQALANANEVQLPLTVEALIHMAQESLGSFAVEVGLKVAQCLLEDEVVRRCGKRYERPAKRCQTRFGHQGGFVTIAGQKLPVRKPRVRFTDGKGEAELDNYALLQSDEAMPEAALRRMVNGVSTRRYEEVVDTARVAFGVKKSSVSRGFVRASADEVQKLSERRFENERFAVIFIDAKSYAGEAMIVVLGVTRSGEKRLLGLRQGATENAAVCSALLEDLRERGVPTDVPTLFVLDGSKALRAAVQRVWGKFGVVQRCQAHKKRNVEAHLPEKHHDELQRQMNAAYHETDPKEALKLLRTTVQWLKRLSPDAAASLQEGLEETLTVVRLNVPPLLRKTLSTTNPIESAFSAADYSTRRVKCWRDGDMRQRWCVAGLLDAERRFHRVAGHKQLERLLMALEQEVHPRPLDSQRKRA